MRCLCWQLYAVLPQVTGSRLGLVGALAPLAAPKVVVHCSIPVPMLAGQRKAEEMLYWSLPRGGVCSTDIAECCEAAASVDEFRFDRLFATSERCAYLRF